VPGQKAFVVLAISCMVHILFAFFPLQYSQTYCLQSSVRYVRRGHRKVLVTNPNLFMLARNAKTISPASHCFAIFCRTHRRSSETCAALSPRGLFASQAAMANCLCVMVGLRLSNQIQCFIPSSLTGYLFFVLRQPKYFTYCGLAQCGDAFGNLVVAIQDH